MAAAAPRRTTMTGVLQMEPDRFDELVALALDEIPPELTAVMDNVVVLVEDEPPDGEPLLGLYQGVPLTRRSRDRKSTRLNSSHSLLSRMPSSA